MRSVETADVLREELQAHPATRAWTRLRPEGVPREIRILKEPSKGIKKSAVYWLAGAGPGGRPVIAKYSRRAAANVEALIYGEILQELPVPAPLYYGTVEEKGPFCWLFMEYVPGERYSPARREHRRLAGSWIAKLHAEAATPSRDRRLPDRGLADHLGTLGQSSRVIRGHVDDPSLAAADASTLHRLAALLAEVQSCWSRLEAICSELPHTLVHGDLVRKNLRVDVAGNGPGFVVAFDWEKAGWGPPAVDLARAVDSERFAANACLDSYRSTSRSAASLTPKQLERQAAAGTVLRCLTAIEWTSQSLGPPWQEAVDDGRGQFLKKRAKTMPRLEIYLSWLETSWRGMVVA